MIRATHLTSEHTVFRESLRAFIAKEILPHVDHWEEAGEIDRNIWRKMGDMGMMGLQLPAEYGGSDLDFYYVMIFCEEISKCFSGGFSIAALVIQFMSAPYLAKYASPILQQKYLPGIIAGTLVSAVAITEPGAGSDVKNMQTTATPEGDYYVVNGSKTFITNGYYGDVLITAVKTDASSGSKGISLLLIDRHAVGVTAHKIKKMGWHASDTAELHFDNVRVPKDHLIGLENHGFQYLMEGLQLERLTASIHNLATAESALAYALDYLAVRKVFGRPLKDFQSLRHTAARLTSEIQVQKAYVNYCCDLQESQTYDVQACSIAKLQTSELAIRVVHECLQFFGGYGFTEDYKIARLYRDVRVGTIIGGTSEIMLEIIAKITLDEVRYT